MNLYIGVLYFLNLLCILILSQIPHYLAYFCWCLVTKELFSTMIIQFSSVQSLSHVRLFETPWTVAARLPCPSPTPGVYLNSCPLSQWCHPTISSSGIPFSSYLQSFPASGSFQMSQFFPSFIGRTDAEAEATILWPPDAKGWLIGKDFDAGKDWRQEENGTTEDKTVGWLHPLQGHEFDWAVRDG